MIYGTLETPDMDSSVIRSLHFQCDLTSPNLQIHTIADEIIRLGVQKGILDKNSPRYNEQQLREKIFEVTWGLIIEGVFLPGTAWDYPNLPRLRLTEYGKQCLAARDIVPHDPDQYLNRIRKQCPGVDSITLLYLGEALQTFRAGRHLATAVMVGVAAENTLLKLVDAVGNALDTPQKRSKSWMWRLTRERSNTSGGRSCANAAAGRIRPTARVYMARFMGGLSSGDGDRRNRRHPIHGLILDGLRSRSAPYHRVLYRLARRWPDPLPHCYSSRQIRSPWRGLCHGRSRG
jgi:hypothetical protein